MTARACHVTARVCHVTARRRSAKMGEVADIMNAAADALGPPVSVELLSKLVEELARLH